MRSPSGIALVTGTLLAVGMMAGSWMIADYRTHAAAQEPKRFFYKIVDVQADTVSMQQILNEYGSAGWELVMVGMGDMTAPRLIFKK